MPVEADQFPLYAGRSVPFVPVKLSKTLVVGKAPTGGAEAGAKIESGQKTRPGQERDVCLSRGLIRDSPIHLRDRATNLDCPVQLDAIGQRVPPGLESAGRGKPKDVPQGIVPQVSREGGVQLGPGVSEVGQRSLEGV